MTRMNSLTPVIATLALAALLSACGKRDEQTSGQKLDEAIKKTEQAGADMKAEAKQMGQEAKDAMDKAAAESSQAMTDAGITTRINAALAADSRLKATKIDVDTKNGAVTLIGSAPDADSLQRATVLAQAVDGVKQVDNRLVVTR
jgi:hyperosmotically inducible periplasmic protein